MPALTFFTARLYLEAITADEDDVNFDPETKGVNAGVTIVPGLIDTTLENPRFLPLNDAVEASTLTTPALLALAPIRAKIDNGRLKLRADDQYNIQGYVATYGDLPGGLDSGDYGKAWVVLADGLLYMWAAPGQFPGNGLGEPTLDQPDVRLVAGTDVLDLPEGKVLGYRIDFDHVTYGGADRKIPSFAVAAPDSDEVLDLATATRVRY